MEKNRPKGENHYMKHARKWLACLLAGALALAVLAGCSALMGGTVPRHHGRSGRNAQRL